MKLQEAEEILRNAGLIMVNEEVDTSGANAQSHRVKKMLDKYVENGLSDEEIRDIEDSLDSIGYSLDDIIWGISMSEMKYYLESNQDRTFAKSIVENLKDIPKSIDMLSEELGDESQLGSVFQNARVKKGLGNFSYMLIRIGGERPRATELLQKFGSKTGRKRLDPAKKLDELSDGALSEIYDLGFKKTADELLDRLRNRVVKGRAIWLAVDWLKEAVKACKALKPWSEELGDFDILKYPNIPFIYKDAVKHLGIEKDQDEKLLLAKAFLKAFPYGGSGDHSYSFSSPGRPKPEDLVRFEKRERLADARNKRLSLEDEE